LKAPFFEEEKTGINLTELWWALYNQLDFFACHFEQKRDKDTRDIMRLSPMSSNCVMIQVTRVQLYGLVVCTLELVILHFSTYTT
jgi:hypothetical protein